MPTKSSIEYATVYYSLLVVIIEIVGKLAKTVPLSDPLRIPSLSLGYIYSFQSTESFLLDYN